MKAKAEGPEESDADSSGSDLPLGFNSRGIPKWRVMEMERLRFVVFFLLEASLI